LPPNGDDEQARDAAAIANALHAARFSRRPATQATGRPQESAWKREGRRDLLR
jgi:hypothetical protein